MRSLNSVHSLNSRRSLRDTKWLNQKVRNVSQSDFRVIWHMSRHEPLQFDHFLQSEPTLLYSLYLLKLKSKFSFPPVILFFSTFCRKPFFQVIRVGGVFKSCQPRALSAYSLYLFGLLFYRNRKSQENILLASCTYHVIGEKRYILFCRSPLDFARGAA